MAPFSTARAAGSITISTPGNAQALSGGSVTVSGTTTPNTTVVVKEGTKPLAWVISNGSGVWSATIQGVSNGSHSYTAQSIANTYAYFAGAGSDDTLNRLRLSDNAINPSGGGWPFITAATWLLPAPLHFNSTGIGYFAQAGNPTLTPGKFDINALAEPSAVTSYEANPNSNTGEFSNDGTKWYGVNTDLDSISVVDVASNTQTATIAVGDQPNSVKYTETGLILVTNQADNTVSVINATNNTVITTFAIACPTVASLGGTLPIPGKDAFYANCSTDGIIKKIDITNGDELTQFDVSGDLSPLGPLFLSPDNKKLYAAGFYGTSSADKMLVINAETGLTLSTINLSGASFGPSMSPDGQYFYTSVQGAFDMMLIDVISTTSDTVVDTLDVSTLGIPGPIAFGAPETASANVTITMTDSMSPAILPEVGAPVARLLVLFAALTISTAVVILHKKMKVE